VAKVKAKGGKKNRKHGRNKVFCSRYLAENREAKNKARKIAKAKKG
jgi:hypothetical protein